MKSQYQLTTIALQKQFMQGPTPLTVLHNITLHFSQGNTYAITGVSGSGKSTLLSLLAGLDEPTSGNVFFNEQSLSSFSSTEKTLFFNKHLGLVFQQPYLIRELSVLENIMLKGMIVGKSYAECAEESYALLHRVGLSDKAQSRPASLSGGQQQRIAILRALFNQPVFLLADEPTGNLDKKTGEGIIDFLLECQEIWNMAIIISSHDEYVVQRMEAVFLLREGRVTEI